MEGSPQIRELSAVVRVFEKFSEPLNLVTDLAYVAGVTGRAEHTLLKEVSNPKLFKLLSKLVHLLSHKEHSYHVMHVRLHTGLPGPIAEGNQRADALEMAVDHPNIPNVFTQARLSHKFYHQNVPALMRMFHLPRAQARAIVATCPNCQCYQIPSLNPETNPRGLSRCHLWQMDVTYFSPFGKLKYIHESIDTFSGAMFASAHTGEKARDVVKHCMMAFSILGTPEDIKIDNGPAYTTSRVRDFFQQWGMKHTTGIPHSPMGQLIVEGAHQTLKRLLHQRREDQRKRGPLRGSARLSLPSTF